MATDHDDALLAMAGALRTLDPAAPPQWGRMTPQHMVEHLADTFGISHGRIVVPLASPEERLPVIRRFLLGPSPMPRGFVSPVTPDLAALRQPDLEAALRELIAEIEAYRAFFAGAPEARILHPVFGPLDAREWEICHRKHMRHHLEQFGVEEPGAEQSAAEQSAAEQSAAEQSAAEQSAARSSGAERSSAA